MRTVKVYLRKCLNCKDKFMPRNSSQVVCGVACSTIYAAKQRGKEQKEKNKVIAEKLKTKNEHLNELQKIFNKFIRTRDHGLPCISCGTTNNVQYAAGHYFPVGRYPGLRFDEDNAHLQCNMYCNGEMSGNIPEYSINLPLRIGQERFESLKARRGQKMQYSIPELMELKTLYKNKIKSSKMLGEKEGKL